MKTYKLFFLGLALLLAALMIAIIAGVFNPAAPQATTARRPTAGMPTVGGQQTARQAYEKLQAWAADNELPTDIVSVSAAVQRGQPSEAWTFQVTHGKRLSIVMVRPDGVDELREQAALYKQQPLAQDAWAVDSNAALAAWWEKSGQTAWSQAEAQNFYVHLGRDTTGALTWTVTVLDEESNVLDLFRMNATNGALIPTPAE